MTVKRDTNQETLFSLNKQFYLEKRETSNRVNGKDFADPVTRNEIKEIQQFC